MSQETKKDTQTTIGKTSANAGRSLEKAGSVLDKGAKTISRWNDRRHNQSEEKFRPLNLEEDASKTSSTEIGATSISSSDTNHLDGGTSTEASESSSSVVDIKTNVSTKNEGTQKEVNASKQQDKPVNENLAKTDVKAKPLKDGTVDSKNESSSLLGIKTLVDSKNTKVSNSQQNKESALEGIKTHQSDTADVKGVEEAEIVSASTQKEDGKLKGAAKKVGRFVNKKTFQFEKSQGKISKTATVIGKTAVVSGKAIKGISSTSGKISKIQDEGGGGVQFAQSEMQKKVVKKGGKIAKKVGKTATKTTFKAGKKAGKSSIKLVKSSIKAGSKAGKAVGGAVKKVVTVVVQTVGKAVSAVASFLAPYIVPILLIIASFLILIVVFSNDDGYKKMSDNCSVYTATNGTMEQNARSIFKYLTSKGLSDEAASGVLGNIERESSFDPGAIEASNGEGHGIIQWSFGRKDALFAEAARQGKNWDDLQFQLDYLWKEAFTDGYYHNQLKNEGFYTSKDPVQTAYLFHKIVEVSADSYDAVVAGRGGAAKKWYDLLKGTGGTGNALTGRVVWIGDSRTVGMKSAVSGGNDVFIAESGQGYNWFINTGLSQANSKLQDGDTIVFNLGVNDIGNANQYLNKLNELVNGSWKGKDIIFMSINPVDDAKSRYVKNSDIEAFNKKMKDGLDSKIKYVDTYSEIKKDLKTDSEGIHYDSETYNKIYDTIRNKNALNACDGYGYGGSVDGIPDFSRKELWQAPHNTYPIGQCTWYSAGALLDLYGTKLDFNYLGNGDNWVSALTQRHPQYFVYGSIGSTPVVGSVFSATTRNHVGVVLAVDGDQITILDGNTNGLTDSWEVATSGTDYQIATYSKAQLEAIYAPIYAKPTKALQDLSKK